MKRILGLVALVAAFGAAYWWFSRNEPPPPPPLEKPAAEDPAIAERRTLFGDEALDPRVEWRKSGLGCRIDNPGTPPRAGLGTMVKMSYVGRLKDGTVFDKTNEPTEFRSGMFISGLSTGLQMLGTGGKAVFYIPPSLGYSSRKVMGIPPNSGLIFEVEVISVTAN